MPLDPHDPNLDRPSSDLPPTRPNLDPNDTSTAWLPLVLVVALLIGAGIYFAANTSDTDAIFGTPPAAKTSPQSGAVPRIPTPN